MNLGSGMLVFFFLFLKISADTYTTASARAYGFVFERHQRCDFFVEKLYGMRARALGAVHACPRGARGRPRRLLLSRTRRQLAPQSGQIVVWPIKSRQTNKQTDKHTLLFIQGRRHRGGRGAAAPPKKLGRGRRPPPQNEKTPKGAEKWRKCTARQRSHILSVCDRCHPPPQSKFGADAPVIGIDELTKVGSDQRSSTIQYDSKSKHSKRRQTVNWTWEVACWFSFSLFFENLGSYVCDSACARVRFCFWKASAQRFFRWEVVRHARACSRCAHACPPRARGRPRRLGCSRSTPRPRRKVDKCRVADKKQTNQQTNRQTHTTINIK